MPIVPPKGMQTANECSNVNGHWLPEDRSFGWKGMNVPRTRHASEIIKTRSKDVTGKWKDIYTMWVFGGYNAQE